MRDIYATNGGRSPVWSRDGRELYYRNTKGMIIAAAITTGSANPIGASLTLFDASRYYFDYNEHAPSRLGGSRRVASERMRMTWR